ncbi:MAG: hypothetical protein ACLQOO_26450 [Terriglobia bacterium]
MVKKAMLRRLVRDDQTHFVDLAEHFFRRFFDSEFIGQGGESHLTLVHILAVLALPGIFYTFFQYSAYDFIAQHHPNLYPAISLVDHCRYVIFSMVVIGFVAVLEWDALFPDRRDYAILTPLPLKVASIFAAQIAALAAFVALFVITVSGPATIFYPCVAAMGIPGGRLPLSYIGWTIVAHAAAVLGGSAFMFLCFVGLQGVLINLLRPRWFKWISLAVQVLSMIALLSMFFLLPLVSTLVASWKKAGSINLYLLPPMWFLGLYQTLLGSHDPVYASLARIAVRGLCLVTLVSAVTYFLSYRRFVRRTIEQGGDEAAEPGRIEFLLGRLADRFVVRKPMERAVFYFVGKTIARSARHRLYLAAYVGVGFAFVTEGLVALLSAHRPSSGPGLASNLPSDLIPGLTSPDAALLSIPLVLSFFALSGMRVVFPIPAELRANWIFQLTENERRRECLAGVRKSMLVWAIVPLIALLWPVSAFLWGWRVASLEFLFALTLSLILMELLLLRFFKIPFTCSYLPGKANITLTGFFYWLAFSTYAYTMASLEAWLLQHLLAWGIFYVLLLTAWAGLVSHRNRVLGEGFVFAYEDNLEPAVRELNLSE